MFRLQQMIENIKEIFYICLGLVYITLLFIITAIMVIGFYAVAFIILFVCWILSTVLKIFGVFLGKSQYISDRQSGVVEETTK